jgi:hypothetical protein
MRPNVSPAPEPDQATFWAKSERDQTFFGPRDVTEFDFGAPEPDRICQPQIGMRPNHKLE